MAIFADADTLTRFMTSTPAMFAQGVQGYADDRIADGPGSTTFDVSAVRCPVVVIHGVKDTICPVSHGHHTASIVPGSELRLFDELGHFSIVLEALPALDAVLARR
jgi:pimeloyl-ACP methyl ester carboxylesterase